MNKIESIQNYNFIQIVHLHLEYSVCKSFLVLLTIHRVLAIVVAVFLLVQIEASIFLKELTTEYFFDCIYINI